MSEHPYDHEPERYGEVHEPGPDGTHAVQRGDSDLGSIVDTILGLEELLSADVRRAEDVYRLYRRPDLQAKITELEERLDAVTDDAGRPLATGDDSLAGGDSARSLALEIQQLRSEYLRESGLVKLRQMDGEEWEAFLTKWKTERAKSDGPGLNFWNALIAETVIEPNLNVTNVIKLRQLYGAPQTDKLGKKCWDLNSESGVSVPKSLRSSLVLKRLELETS